MWPLRVILHLLLALAGDGGEVEGEHKLTWPAKQQQRAAAGAKEIQAGIDKELKRVGRTSREMQPFDRPTTLQRMIEEATHFRQDGRLLMIAMIAGHNRWWIWQLLFSFPGSETWGGWEGFCSEGDAGDDDDDGDDGDIANDDFCICLLSRAMVN